MKENNEAKIRDKLILLIILGFTAGFILLQPYQKTTDKKPGQAVSKTVDNQNLLRIVCNNPDSEIARLVDEKDIKWAPDVCLYQGCSGFTY